MNNVRTVTIEPSESRRGHYCWLTIYRGVLGEYIEYEKTKDYDDPRQAYAAAVSRQAELMGVSRG